MTKVKSSAVSEIIERLSYSEQRFRLLVESVQDYALFILDPVGRVASWNQGAQRMKGYRPEEIVGTHFSQFYTREDIAAGKPDAALEEATSGGRVEDEGWRLRKDGSRFWAAVVITALRDESGWLRGFGNMTRDLTERTKLTQRFNESDAMLETFMAHCPSLMLIKDLNGRYRYVNEQFCRSFGLERDAVLGHTDAEIFPSAQATQFQADDASVVAARAALEFEETAEYQDGQHVSIVCKFPIRDADGQIAALGGVATDITKRQRCEGKPNDITERETMLALHQNTDYPAESKGEQRADQKANDRDVDALALMISRDLRPPLRNIETLAAQVREEMAGLDAMAKRLDLIAQSAVGLTRLTNELLMFSRSGGLNQANCRLADLDSIVAAARKELGPAASSSRIHWNIAQLPRVVGDPALLRAVFEQMLSNAVKFTRQRDPATIEVATRTGSGNEVVIEIKDNGVGFNEQYSHKLFGAFQHLHRDNQFEGAGIGLAMAKRIIECHGGRIWAKSQAGEGASFYFTLWRAAAQPKKTGEDHERP
jgi:PAS domain S-box-containing protein